ncbi:threonylcarbamoyl-AMP synthase [Betaproteobacteria bacterium]|nr:threonylcarbamoyl-AMP synthase [Betaproteobacteria bacterium]GHU41722.1 threonylcarbamoyl-AMP synthase [Betaproteobacteria bacterium]
MPNTAILQKAAALLQAGELVAFPTETVYGLGADAANPLAVQKIFAAKGRPSDHPLIVHLSDMESLAHWATEIPPVAYQLAEAFWPGPLTLILKKQAWVPTAVTGGQDTVGLRTPAHPLALQLIRAFAELPGSRGGVAAPSANRFGRISPTTAAHVQEELGGRIAQILDGGACQVGIESTILDLSRLHTHGAEILRPGGLDPMRLAEVLGEMPKLREVKAQDNAPRVSGSLLSHYAPTTPLQLVDSATLAGFLPPQPGARYGVLAYSPLAVHATSVITMPAEPVAYAHKLYAALRELDAQNLDLIIAEAPPATLLWNAVCDRLRRAAAAK